MRPPLPLETVPCAMESSLTPPEKDQQDPGKNHDEQGAAANDQD